MLAHTPRTVEHKIDGLVENLLPPRSKDDDQNTLFDLETVLNLYLDRFEQTLPHEIQDPSEQPTLIESTLRGIPEPVIRRCSAWVSHRLMQRGRVSFTDVFDAYAKHELSEVEQQVCLLHIGSLAANSDPAIQVDIGTLPIKTALWRADDLTLMAVTSTQSFEE